MILIGANWSLISIDLQKSKGGNTQGWGIIRVHRQQKYSFYFLNKINNSSPVPKGEKYYLFEIENAQIFICVFFT